MFCFIFLPTAGLLNSVAGILWIIISRNGAFLLLQKETFLSNSVTLSMHSINDDEKII